MRSFDDLPYNMSLYNSTARKFLAFYEGLDVVPLNLTLGKEAFYDFTDVYSPSPRSTDHSCVQGLSATACMNLRARKQTEAGFNMLLIMFVIVMLLFFTSLLSTAASKLVLRPVRRVGFASWWSFVLT